MDKASYGRRLQNRARRVRLALTIVASAAGGLPFPVLGQNAQWSSTPGSADFGTAANWTPATVPTGVASFGASSMATLEVNSAQTLGGLSFLAGAPAYTLNINNIVEFTGAGIVNPSGATQTVTVNGSGSILTFSNASAANGVAIVNGNASNLIFDDTSSAGTASITNAGTLCFCNNASAGSASITNTSMVNFFGQTTAGSATLINQGGGTINFTADSTGGTARYVGQGGTLDIAAVSGGSLTLGSIAGTGTIDLGSNNLVIGSNGSTEFSGTINGSGGLEIAGGTQTLSGANGFTGVTQIDAGATLALKDGGSIATSDFVSLAGATAAFDISQTTAGTAIIGLTGTGTVSLGSKTLTLTAGAGFDGVLQDGGIGGGSGGALVLAANAAQSLGGANTYTGATTILAGATLTLTGAGSIAASSAVNLAGAGATFDIASSGAGQAIRDLSGVAGSTILLGNNTLTVGTANATSFAGVIGGTGGLVKQGSGTLTLSGVNTYAGGTMVTGGLINFATANNLGTGTVTLNGGGLQWATGNSADISARLVLGAGGGTIDTNGNDVSLASTMAGTGGLTKAGAGTLSLGAVNSYAGGTTINAGTLLLLPGAAIGSGPLTINGGTFNTGGNNITTASLSGSGGSIVLNGGSLTDNSAGSTTLAASLSGSGALIKQGAGTLMLTGTNSYGGGTTVSGGILAGTTSSLQGNILNNATVAFNQTTSGTYAGRMSGSGGVTLQGGGVNFTGANTYTGPTAINGGTLAVNGSITSNVTVNAGGTLGGNGTIFGSVVTAGTLAPGNSIGTLNVNGTFVQSAGSFYSVEVNNAGQSDRLNVTGTAVLNGGTVAVQAQPGGYARNTTYTILTAGGGVSGTYAHVTSNFAFLTPSLSYDANNAYLRLFLSQSAFAQGARTANQAAVGAALDRAYAGATGDFTTVIDALSLLGSAQGPWVLNQISGQPYADLGSLNVASNALFMNALGQQMAMARGGAAGKGQRVALAEACEVASCDGTGPLSVWASMLGGVGSVQGNSNSSTFTYNLGGAAAGIDYRLDPRFLVGLATGYTSGTQGAESFMGKSWSDAVSIAAYGSFTQSNLYVDALAGYAYANNQMQRQIMIPGLQPRTANGSTGANQFLGQIETGYAFRVHAPAHATLTPFARFQASSISQASFGEWGASSLSLDVAQQTTASLRSTLGADLAGAIGPVTLGLRLGWLHEYASTARPITASFAGAPTARFTVYGPTPQRDSAVIGFSATTGIASATQIFLRYEGELASGNDNHALTAGLRLSW